jgi:hypothetical protein
MPENFAPDATQLPTGCQPESLAKPARGRSHKAAQPQLLTRRASSTIIRLRQKTSQSRDTRQRRVVLQSCFCNARQIFSLSHIADQISCSAVTKLQQMGVGNGEPLH